MAGIKLMTFAQWRAWAVGKLIDIDGAYGAQCWDLWADYAIRTQGATAMSTYTSQNAGNDSGYASSLWTAFPARPGIDTHFVKLGRDITPREGDVAVWARSAAFPGSHVAMCTGRTRPGQVECVSQNDQGTATAAAGATHVTWITTNGLLGYLRPKSNHNDQPVSPAEGEEDMPWIAVVGGAWYLVVPTGNGKPNATVLAGDSGAEKQGMKIVKFASTEKLRKVVNIV